MIPIRIGRRVHRDALSNSEERGEKKSILLSMQLHGKFTHNIETVSESLYSVQHVPSTSV
jgi:hypothetical protein